MRTLALGLLVFACACTTERRDSSTSHSAYVPRTRDITMTTVPLMVKEMQGVLPFLRDAFAKGGTLDGKEVYGFSPSTIVAGAGDTLRFTFVNPEDDVHSFVLPDFAVSLPGNSITHATYIAKHAGIFTFTCAIQSHLPMMSGQLVVLDGASIATADAPSPVRPH
jgi:plastocyanin